MYTSHISKRNMKSSHHPGLLRNKQTVFVYKQTFSDKSVHDKKQYFVTHLHETVTLFKKSMQKLAFFTSK